MAGGAGEGLGTQEGSTGKDHTKVGSLNELRDIEAEGLPGNVTRVESASWIGKNEAGGRNQEPCWTLSWKHLQH